MSHILTATLTDYPYLAVHDRHISAQMLQRKIAAGEMLVAKQAGQVIAWLRYGFFWDSLPFMNHLFVLVEQRGKGVGTQLVTHWESEMATQGYTRVLTSTQSDKTAQHFYRKLGYQDIGALLLPNEPLEIILLKNL